jgi:hypothetical protein
MASESLSPLESTAAAFKEYTNALLDAKMCHELAMEGGDDAERALDAICHARLYAALEIILDSVNSNPPDLELGTPSVLVLIQEEGEGERTLALSTAPFPVSEEHFGSKEALDTFFHFLTDSVDCTDLGLLTLPKVHERHCCLSVAQHKQAKVVLRPWSATLQAHDQARAQAATQQQQQPTTIRIETDVVCIVSA